MADSIDEIPAISTDYLLDSFLNETESASLDNYYDARLSEKDGFYIFEVQQEVKHYIKSNNPIFITNTFLYEWAFKFEEDRMIEALAVYTADGEVFLNDKIIEHPKESFIYNDRKELVEFFFKKKIN